MLRNVTSIPETDKNLKDVISKRRFPWLYPETQPATNTTTTNCGTTISTYPSTGNKGYGCYSGMNGQEGMGFSDH